MKAFFDSLSQKGKVLLPEVKRRFYSNDGSGYCYILLKFHPFRWTFLLSSQDFKTFLKVFKP